MRFLKVLTIGMGVLIVVATTVLVVVIARRIGGAGPAPTSGCGPAGRACGHADRRRSPPRGIGWRCGSRVAVRTGWCWSTHAPAALAGAFGCGRAATDGAGLNLAAGCPRTRGLAVVPFV